MTELPQTDPVPTGPPRSAVTNVASLARDVTQLREDAVAAVEKLAFWDAGPNASDCTVRKSWGRLFTFGDQWEYEQVAVHGRTDFPPQPPPGWYPGDGLPSWTESDEPKTGYEPIWIVEWERK